MKSTRKHRPQSVVVRLGDLLHVRASGATAVWAIVVLAVIAAGVFLATLVF